MKVGILLGERRYYTPYLKWLFSVPNIDCFIHTTDRGLNIFPEARSINNTRESLIDNCDVILSLGYPHKISIDEINAVSGNIVNIHHSYRLQYRGRHMCSWNIINHEEYAGSSIHYMNENLDDGPIIDTEKVDILFTDTAETLFHKVHDLGATIAAT